MDSYRSFLGRRCLRDALNPVGDGHGEGGEVMGHPASDEVYAVQQAALIARFKARAAKPVPEVRLGRRELEYVALVVEGKKRAEIARIMGISEKTCAQHRENILLKIDGKTNQDIVFYAMKLAGGK